MTIYSGFATRKQEQRYDGFIIKAIDMLSQIIITYVESAKIQPFSTQFHRIFNVLSKMDTLKHCTPKISPSLTPLAQHFGIITSDDISQLGSDLGQSYAKVNQKRPLTSNFIKQKPTSIEMERNTINIAPNKRRQLLETDHKKTPSSFSGKRYEYFQNKKDEGRQFRSKSFTAKKPKLKEVAEKLQNYQKDVTMEELMEKNRLIQRKMSMFRKKKYVQQSKIPAKIQELDQEDQLSFF